MSNENVITLPRPGGGAEMRPLVGDDLVTVLRIALDNIGKFDQHEYEVKLLEWTEHRRMLARAFPPDRIYRLTHPRWVACQKTKVPVFGVVEGYGLGEIELKVLGFDRLAHEMPEFLEDVTSAVRERLADLDRETMSMGCNVVEESCAICAASDEAEGDGGALGE